MYPKRLPQKDPGDEIQGSVETEAPVPPRVVLTAPGVHTLHSGAPGHVHVSTVGLLQTFFSCLVAQSCLTLCDPVDCSPPGSSVHGVIPAKIPERVAICFSRVSPQPGVNPGLLHWQERLYH